MFVIVYSTKALQNGNLAREFDQFNQEQYTDDRLTASTLVFDEDHAMVLVQDFINKGSALSYFGSLEDQGLLNDYASDSFNAFVITKENFEIFYKTKDLKGYLSFFNNFYLE